MSNAHIPNVGPSMLLLITSIYNNVLTLAMFEIKIIVVRAKYTYTCTTCTTRTRKNLCTCLTNVFKNLLCFVLSAYDLQAKIILLFSILLDVRVLLYKEYYVCYIHTYDYNVSITCVIRIHIIGNSHSGMVVCGIVCIPRISKVYFLLICLLAGTRQTPKCVTNANPTYCRSIQSLV